MEKNTLLKRICSNKSVVIGIKYIPVIATILITLHIALLLLGIYEPITMSIAVILLLILLVLLSIRFNFCILHKILVIYMALMALCICIEKFHGFGAALLPARLIMFGAGCVLCVLLIIKLHRNNGKCQ